MNRRIAVLQTAALPLGYAAKRLERETGFEPATSTLARLHSTAELFPLFFRDSKCILKNGPLFVKIKTENRLGVIGHGSWVVTYNP